WIQSVYVAPPARQRGLYRALHDEVRKRALEEGTVVGLRLYVASENHRAMEVYRRVGMSETPYRLFEEEL
ncbi:MAG TPA: GNAT family N-acetyltransferase, partial [Planctomycetes bacterium]|nr:GNAT family N-acetyltransferase [Planctomycetota bacterium]